MFVIFASTAVYGALSVMNPEARKSVLSSLLLGVFAPHIWALASGFFALYAGESLTKLLWHTFALKGEASFLLSTALQSLLFGVILAIAIRIVSGRRWLLQSVAFSLAFLTSFYVPGLLQEPRVVAEGIAFTVLAVGGVLVCTVLALAVAVRVPRRNGPLSPSSRGGI